MNCDDAIIALERERLQKIKVELAAKKKAASKRAKQVKEAKAIVATKGKNATEWTVQEIQAMIQGKNPSQPVSGKKRETLLELWNEKLSLI